MTDVHKVATAALYFEFGAFLTFGVLGTIYISPVCLIFLVLIPVMLVLSIIGGIFEKQ